MNWIDINNEKPDFGKHVSIWPIKHHMPNEPVHVMYLTALPNKFKYSWNGTEYWATGVVTHWQELPDGPLLDCPFCGNKDIYFHINEAGCQNCGATATSRAKWNMRK